MKLIGQEWWDERRDEVQRSMDEAIILTHQYIEMGWPVVACSFAKEAAFYAFKLHPELREFSNA